MMRFDQIAFALAVAVLTIGCEKESSGVPAPTPSTPDVILVTIDTLRADHLGAYGYERDTSPVLDALAADGTAVPHCYAQSATTGASHAALFTGLDPPLAGVISNDERFPSDAVSIMDRVRDLGYETGAFVSGIVVSRRFGIHEDFDHFDDEFSTTEVNRPSQAERPAPETLRAASEWLASRTSGRPVFTWIHLIDPHGPYDPPEQSERFVGDPEYESGRELVASADDFPFSEIPAYQVLGDERDAGYYVARYDAEIRYADTALGDFFDRLRDAGRWENTLLLVTSDHGETLAEPNRRRLFSHTIVAYEEVSRVPLIVREEAGRDDLERLGSLGVVRLVDLAPTLLARLGAEPLPRTSGRNLLAGGRSEFAVTLGAYGSGPYQILGTQHSVRFGPWRYILNLPKGEEELYDHRTDPGETRNLAASHPEQVRAGQRELRRTLARKKRRFEPIVDDDETIRHLRSLGYLR